MNVKRVKRKENNVSKCFHNLMFSNNVKPTVIFFYYYTKLQYETLKKIKNNFFQIRNGLQNLVHSFNKKRKSSILYDIKCASTQLSSQLNTSCLQWFTHFFQWVTRLEVSWVEPVSVSPSRGFILLWRHRAHVLFAVVPNRIF